MFHKCRLSYHPNNISSIYRLRIPDSHPDNHLRTPVGRVHHKNNRRHTSPLLDSKSRADHFLGHHKSRSIVRPLPLRHSSGSNSVKMYNELNNLRFESTVNNPYAFLAYRHKQGKNKDADKKLRPIRKGVADIALRAQASQSINNRFTDQVAATRTSQPFRTVFASVTHRKRKRGRSVRALVPTGKDLALLSALADPRLTVNGFRNKDLRELLADNERYVGKTEKQRSGMTTRAIRLFRDHGVIRRLPKARRYQLTSHGRQFATALQASLAASTEQLMAIAA